MARNPKVVKAFRAMKDLGFSEDKVKPVLKNLLKVFDKNWEPIEAENYSVLVDSIFEHDEIEAAAKKKAASVERDQEEEEEEEEAHEQDEVERPLKRLRLRHQQGQSSQSLNNNSLQAGASLIVPKDEPVELPEVSAPNLFQSTEATTELCKGDTSSGTQYGNSQLHDKDRMKQPLSATGLMIQERSDLSHCPYVDESWALTIPHEDPLPDDSVKFEVPVPVIHPETGDEQNSSQKSRPAREQDAFALVVSESVTEDHTSRGLPAAIDIGTGGELADRPFESSSQLQIASSALGELGSEKSAERTQTTSKTDSAETNLYVNPYVVAGLPSNSVNGFLNTQYEAGMASPSSLDLPLFVDVVDGTPHLLNGVDSNGNHSGIEQNGVDNANCKSLVVVQEHQPTRDQIRSLRNVVDICRGHERVVISVLNDVNNECPPSFHYIPQNVVFQNACVNFFLARIGDDNCCLHCFGDCLSLSTPCACAHESGSQFVYTSDGLVKEEFLEECVSMNRDPEKHCLFFCKECPLGRFKNEEIIEPCKGHLVRKFIKECWWKCGCSKLCGNRVVQRGITRSLQVFMTKGKGWGLRSLEDLPKGAFVCEYVGEILTNGELFNRVSKRPEGKVPSYPVLLDAGWKSEAVLKDEEALCLDATYYGNIARFINHRCFDSTLVKIPVEIETPDHHYYHLAYFTSRKVKAMEELTLDYGIDFDDLDHPAEAFRCQCGSKFCRDMRRPSRSRLTRS